MTADEALARLKDGNRKFIEGRARHEHSSSRWRAGLLSGQQPFAVVLGCSDSRVPPELVFHQAFGDLFVVRNAGNVVATDVLGSIEFAVLYLKTPLVVVMGHQGCGAVTAALASAEHRQREPEELQALLRMIDPALARVDRQQDPRHRIAAGVEANVRWSVKQLADLRDAQGNPTLKSAKIVGAVYGLERGEVRFLE